MPQSVCIGFGKANFQDVSFNLAAFVVEPDWHRQFPSKVLGSRGATQEFPASDFPNINGRLWMSTVDGKDDKILNIQISHFRGGRPIRNGAVFIRLRETGPMYAVRAILPPHRQSKFGDAFLAFQGRGDLLSLEELAEEGIIPSKVWVEGYLDSAEVQTCYDIRVTDEETSSRPKMERVVSLSGKEVMIKDQQLRRRMRVKR